MKKIIFVFMFLSFGYLFAREKIASEFSEFENETQEENTFLNHSVALQVEQGQVISNKMLRLRFDKSFDHGGIYSKTDLIKDDIKDLASVDVRELRFQYKLTHWLDLSLGRQVSTWGVGDMLFINDLFPKNWMANFQGRDMEMLKDPSNSIRLTSYNGELITDIVYTPKFSADTFPRGCVFESLDVNSGEIKKNSAACGEYEAIDSDGDEIQSGEFALSVKRKIGTQEVALYFYDGYYKSPKGVMFNSVAAYYHPALSVQGLSSEGQFGPGIFSFEFGYYQSKEDRSGENYFIENSKLKYLIGYKADLSSHFSYGLQWYQEKMENYKQYEDSIININPSAFDYRKKEYQNTFTLRLTYKALNDTLYISIFGYVRPEDKDSLTKIEISKKLSDDIKLTAGLNIFEGQKNYLDREFGMLKNEDNAFLRLNMNF